MEEFVVKAERARKLVTAMATHTSHVIWSCLAPARHGIEMIYSFPGPQLQ